MSKFVIMATWDDAPHLTKEQKDELLLSIPPFQRDARSKGIPQLGSGAILPVNESDYLIDDFKIPDYWGRVYGMDVGWNWTTATHIAYDKGSDVAYVYYVYKRSQAEPSIHAQAIRAPGTWIPGVIDPAANGRSQKDGHQLIGDYVRLGLNLVSANNSVEAGLLQFWQRLSSGRLKVFKSCQPWVAEARLYRRDEKGKVVKKNDHLMDSTRYALVSGLDIAKVFREKTQNYREAPGVGRQFAHSGKQEQAWMGG